MAQSLSSSLDACLVNTIVFYEKPYRVIRGGYYAEHDRIETPPSTEIPAAEE